MYLWMFQGYLTEEALAAVKELLPESAGGDLAAVCSWPDEIRFRMRWSSALHYIDTPDFKCNYEYCSKFDYFLRFKDAVSMFLETFVRLSQCHK